MKKACFIIPYYGSFPNYFPLWLQSAKANPKYDFYFITDIDFQLPTPNNVFFIDMPFFNIVDRVKQVLNIKPALNNAYKLCDFKPAYALLFPEIVERYPFWGYIDIDMIFGNLDSFLSDCVFEKYDKIGKQGHLTLFRNCKACNNFFLTDTSSHYPNYQTAFQSEYCFHFDESGLIAHSDDYGIRSCAVGDYYDVMPQCFPFLVMLENGGLAPSVAEYSEGLLSLHYIDSSDVKSKEILYIHFQKRTMTMASNLSCSNYLAIPNRFILSHQIDREYIENVNRNRFYWEWHKRRLHMIISSIKDGGLKHRFQTMRANYE